MFRKKAQEKPEPSERECGEYWETGGYAGIAKRAHECGVKVISPYRIHHDGPHKCRRCGVEKPK